MSDVTKKLISVVIATLGGKQLTKTINDMNSGSVVPSEILICIPEDDSPKVKNINDGNVRVVITKHKGQVYQRATGFKNAKNDIVMQLDDDILLDKYCIENMLKTLHVKGTKAVVAPSYFCDESKNPVYRQLNNRKFLIKLYYWLINGADGYKPGEVSLSGVNFGAEPFDCKDDICEVEWLAGGCAMHYKENLVLDNYYPFDGKAYGEDLIHSHFMKKNGCSLFISTKAHCWIETVPATQYKPKELLENLIGNYRAKKYFVKLSSRSYIRMNIYFLFLGTHYIIVILKGWRIQFFSKFIK